MKPRNSSTSIPIMYHSSRMIITAQQTNRQSLQPTITNFYKQSSIGSSLTNSQIVWNSNLTNQSQYYSNLNNNNNNINSNSNISNISSFNSNNNNNNNNNNKQLISSSRLSLHTSINKFVNSSKYLQKYRKIQVNKQPIQQNTSILPQIICSFLNLKKQKSSNTSQQSSPNTNTNTNINSNNNNTNNNNLIFKCACNKTQDNLCQFIISWIQQHYYWKTDRQFNRIYQHYNNKKLQEYQMSQIKINLQKILNILGISLNMQQQLTILQILANYYKHVLYYQKYDKLIKQSNIYIWICLGIMYHIGFTPQNNNSNNNSSNNKSKQNKIIAFWALDIAMDTIGQLTSQIFIKCTTKAYKYFYTYFNNFMSLINQKGINMNQIIYQWIQQMMFGYMGIQSIGFFIDCFKKAGWNYFIKVMLSYLEYRINQIKKQTNFKDRTIDKQSLIKFIVNGKQEWPMIFCSASSFRITE